METPTYFHFNHDYGGFFFRQSEKGRITMIEAVDSGNDAKRVPVNLEFAMQLIQNRPEESSPLPDLELLQTL